MVIWDERGWVEVKEGIKEINGNGKIGPKIKYKNKIVT